MRSSFLQISILVFGSLFVGIVLTIWADKISPSMVLAAPIAVAAAFVVVRHPFLGLVILVSYVQSSAISVWLFGALSNHGTEILVLLALVGLIFIHENRFRAKKQDPAPLAATSVVLLFLAVLISVALAYDPGHALDALRGFAGVVVLCFLVVALTDTTRRYEVILLAIMATTLVSALVVIYDWSFSDNLFRTYSDTSVEGAEERGNRSSGTYSGAATMAATMILCGTALAAVFFVRMPRWRLFTAATVIAGSLGIFLNATRSASLTYLVMAVWLILKLRRNRMFPAILLAVLLSMAIFSALIPTEHWERMSELLEPSKDYTLSRRLSYHVIGLDLLEQFPIFGAGFDNFPLFFDDFDYRWIEGRYASGDGRKQLHNQYMQIAAESGIVGLACYLALLGSCLWGLRGVWKQAASPVIGLLAEAVHFSFVSMLIQIAFLSSKYNKYLWIYVGLAIALHYINKAEFRRLRAMGHRLSSSVER